MLIHVALQRSRTNTYIYFVDSASDGYRADGYRLAFCSHSVAIMESGDIVKTHLPTEPSHGSVPEGTTLYSYATTEKVKMQGTWTGLSELTCSWWAPVSLLVIKITITGVLCLLQSGSANLWHSML